MTSVYVIAAEGGPVKVGIAGNPRRRLSTLRTASAVRLGMVYSAKVAGDARAVERRAHQLLTNGRLSGEWFDVSQDQATAAIALAAAELGCGLQSEDGEPTPELTLLTTGNQLKAARALGGVEQIALAEAAGVSVGTIRNMEAQGPALLKSSLAIIRAVQSALEDRGVEFTNGGQPGVRLRKGGHPAGDGDP